MSYQASPPEQEPKLRHVLREDLRRGDLRRTVSRDFGELREFFLTEERKSRLAGMSRVRRWLYSVVWLLKVLFLRLTPARRVLVILSLVLIWVSHSVQFSAGQVQTSTDTSVAGALLLLFVLMLELKDKLMARHELEAGRAVQKALTPQPCPQVPGWSLWLFTRPANEVGGDLVDFQQIDGNLFGVALGDVSGKGLGAALLMAKLQALLRALMPDYPSLAALGEKLNAVFHRDGVPQHFASLVLLRFATDHGQVRLLNAGHLPPLALRGARAEELPKGEPALGLRPQVVYREHQLALQQGDTLLVYSDGLTEARNEAGEFFGEARLLALLPTLHGLPAPEIGARLLVAVDGFSGQARAHDDLSLVVLQRDVRAAGAGSPATAAGGAVPS